jgi:hypothetical protein
MSGLETSVAVSFAEVIVRPCSLSHTEVKLAREYKAYFATE